MSKPLSMASAVVLAALSGFSLLRGEVIGSAVLGTIAVLTVASIFWRKRPSSGMSPYWQLVASTLTVIATAVVLAVLTMTIDSGGRALVGLGALVLSGLGAWGVYLLVRFRPRKK